MPPKGQNEIEFKDKIFDPQTGREIIRNLTITAPEKYGLPTSTDDDVILALLQLTKQQNNFTRPEVQFTRLQLIEMLGWADKGASYSRIIQSLDRWSSTHLKYENAWWDNEGRRWTNGAFHIIDEYKINDGRSANGQGDLFRSHVTWGKAFFKSCQAGYLKSLDYEFYVKLDFHTSKRMYRFLDKRFYHKLGIDLRAARLRLRAYRPEPGLRPQRQDQGEAPAGHRGTRSHGLPRAPSPRTSGSARRGGTGRSTSSVAAPPRPRPKSRPRPPTRW